jgi:acetolactate synthase-1/2/3 large subunit
LDGTPSPIVISASSVEGGGLFVLQNGVIEQIDRLTTMGLCTGDGRIARVLKQPDATETVTELLIYDARGVQHYLRLDGLGAPHDIRWAGSHYVLVASVQNSVSSISLDGTVTTIWQAPGESDSWHINCLCERDGELYLSVFGKFATHRGWDETRGTSGFLMKVSDNSLVATGLSQPHTPRFVDGSWIICNSAKHELLQIDPASATVTRNLALEGYTRGIAVFEDVLLVGESAGRYATDRPTATICVIDRKNWNVLDRISLPTKEIYDIVAVDERLLNGLKTGFRTSRFRNAESDQNYLFQQAGIEPVRIWAISEPLPESAFKIEISAQMPESIIADATVEIPVRLRNDGGAILITAPPNPVLFCYRWVSPVDNTEVDSGHWLHTPLPRAVPPGTTVEARIEIAAPALVGEYLLRVTLLQENVAWFDAIRDSNASVHHVTVRPQTPTAS